MKNVINGKNLALLFVLFVFFVFLGGGLFGGFGAFAGAMLSGVIAERLINKSELRKKSKENINKQLVLEDDGVEEVGAEAHSDDVEEDIPPFPDSYEWYESYTQDRDWTSICHINGVRFDKFGTKKELNFLSEYLEEGEVVFALASGVMSQTDTSNSFDFGTNTWLVVLTNERFLFMDAAMLTDSVDTQSIRLNRVQAVSASQGVVLGKIMIDLGSRVVTVDNCAKESVKVVADLANKWIRELEKKDKIDVSSQEKLSSTSSLDKLEKLGELYSKGLLSDDEFSRAKDKVISKL